MEITELVMPIGYEIDARQSHFLDDGTPIWILDYKEYHSEKNYKRAKADSIKVFEKLGVKCEFNDEEKSWFYNIQGPKYRITNTLAGEFLGISSLGEMPLKDLMGTLMFALAQSGFKVPKEK